MIGVHAGSFFFTASTGGREKNWCEQLTIVSNRKSDGTSYIDV
jgi:hypothetical protein